MPTLRARLLLRTAVATGLILSISAVALYAILRSALRSQFDETLAAKAQSLASLAEQEAGHIELEFHEVHFPEFEPSARAEYYQVWSSDGRTLARSASLGNADLPRLEGRPDQPAFQSSPLPDGRPGRTIGFTFVPRREEDDAARNISRPPAQITLALARSRQDTESALAWLAALLACGCGGAIVASVLLLSWFVRRGLQPLEAAADQIAAIGESALSSRVNAGDAPAEIAPVIARLNDLLARLEAAFTREKAITADVAHELRTPLAGLRSTLEVSLSQQRSAADHRQAIEKSLTICRQVQRLIENLLELARAEAGQLERARDSFDLVALLQDCWGQFADRAVSRRLGVTWRLPESCPVQSDRTKATLVLNNILDNAVTYADHDGQISIELHANNGQANLQVSNTAIDMLQADVSRVFDRFWRADSARVATGNAPRYGLGLPLCHRLTTLLGGSISATTTNNGAFAIAIIIPTREPE